MNKSISVLLIASSVLSGCAGIKWSKPGGTQQGFNMDMARCRMGIAGTPLPYQTHYSAPGDVGGAMQGLGATMSNIGEQRMYIQNCMAAQGWQSS